MENQINKLLAVAETLALVGTEYQQWTQWCAQVSICLAEKRPSTLSVRSAERKWELVSGYQKSVRRGFTELSCHLMCGMVSLQLERAYMWKRICTVAAEDIGAGNPLLMKFVVACSMAFPPAKTDGQTALNLWGLLTELMCASKKSRIYCNYNIVELALKDGTLSPDALDTLGLRRYKALGKDLKLGFDYENYSAGEKWMIQNNWRAEGMLAGPIWQGLLEDTLTPTKWQAPAPEMMKGLPEYAYDKHTRVGKTTCVKLCAELAGWLQENNVKDKANAVGLALFCAEGRKTQDEWVNQSALDAEALVFVAMFGLQSIAQWDQLVELVEYHLDAHTINKIRFKVLATQEY